MYLKEREKGWGIPVEIYSRVFCRCIRKKEKKRGIPGEIYSRVF